MTFSRWWPSRQPSAFFLPLRSVLTLHRHHHHPVPSCREFCLLCLLPPPPPRPLRISPGPGALYARPHPHRQLSTEVSEFQSPFPVQSPDLRLSKCLLQWLSRVSVCLVLRVWVESGTFPRCTFVGFLIVEGTRVRERVSEQVRGGRVLLSIILGGSLCLRVPLPAWTDNDRKAAGPLLFGRCLVATTTQATHPRLPQ